MSASVHDIARAYLDAASAKDADIPGLNKAVVALLEKNNLQREISSFPRAVEAEMRRRFPTASFTTPDDSDAHAADTVQKAVEKAAGTHVLFDRHADPSLIGGAVLRVGDDRYDASIAGSLRSLSEHLSRLS